MSSRFETFRGHGLRWQKRLGLFDWNVAWVREKSSDKNNADITYNYETRHATVIFYDSCPISISLNRLALHEMLHLLHADLVYISAARANPLNDDIIREEHRVVARLLAVLT